MYLRRQLWYCQVSRARRPSCTLHSSAHLLDKSMTGCWSRHADWTGIRVTSATLACHAARIRAERGPKECFGPDTAVATRDNTTLIEQVQAELETQNTRETRGGMPRESVSLHQKSLCPLDALRRKLSTRLRVLHLDCTPFLIDHFLEFARTVVWCCKTALGKRSRLHLWLRWETVTAVCSTGVTAHA